MSRRKLPPPGGRIVAFDLETTHLRGNMGFILCAVAKEVGAKRHKSWRIDRTAGYGKTPASYRNDRQIVEELVAYLGGADALLAHYGDRFDRPYLNTRALAHGLRPLPPVAFIDPWRIIRKELTLTNNRLGSVSDLARCDRTKYHLPWHDWQAAAYGDRKALKRMEDYCVNDVETLVQEYEIIRPLIYHHPYTAAMPAPGAGPQCPACGGHRLTRQGSRRTKRQVIERLQCQDCGTWSQGARETIK